MDVAQVGRQRRHLRLDVGAVSIPADQGTDREAVAQVVGSRSAGRRTWPQAGLADQFEPGEVGVAVEEPAAGGGDEEGPVRRWQSRSRRRA